MAYASSLQIHIYQESFFFQLCLWVHLFRLQLRNELLFELLALFHGASRCMLHSDIHENLLRSYQHFLVLKNKGQNVLMTQVTVAPIIENQFDDFSFYPGLDIISFKYYVFWVFHQFLLSRTTKVMRFNSQVFSW